MRITELLHSGYEQVVEFSADDFLCYIALHSTKLGPAVGGCRLKPYASSEQALLDVLRLSRAMSYKSSLAGLALGGGKTVVVADRVTRDIMLQVGEAVNYFGGAYIIGEDVGTTLDDIAIAAEQTPYTVHLDGSGMTAFGVYHAIQAAVSYHGDWHNLPSASIWIEGLGKVGWALLQELPDHPNLYVSDLRTDVVAQAVDLGAFAICESDKRFMAVYAPCAIGRVITPANVATIRYPIICGSANNQLTDDGLAEILQRNGVLYCPDYLVNAGGVIAAAGEIADWAEIEVRERCEAIGQCLLNVFELAKLQKITPLAAANVLAEARGI